MPKIKGNWEKKPTTRYSSKIVRGEAERLIPLVFWPSTVLNVNLTCIHLAGSSTNNIKVWVARVVLTLILNVHTSGTRQQTHWRAVQHGRGANPRVRGERLVPSPHSAGRLAILVPHRMSARSGMCLCARWRSVCILSPGMWLFRVWIVDHWTLTGTRGMLLLPTTSFSLKSPSQRLHHTSSLYITQLRESITNSD